jgi:hypothetical protein
MQSPVLLLVDADGAIVRRVLAGEQVDIAPDQHILSLCPRTTAADRLNALLAAGRTEPLGADDRHG